MAAKKKAPAAQANADPQPDPQEPIEQHPVPEQHTEPLPNTIDEKPSVLKRLERAPKGTTHATLGRRAADELAAALSFREVHGATVTLPKGGIHIEVDRLADPDLVLLH